MKKKILVGLLSTGMILGLCGCYTKEDCSTFVSSAGGISVTLHGVKYYTHISNVILIDTKED